jgi:hypothetical protein
MTLELSLPDKNVSPKFIQNRVAENDFHEDFRFTEKNKFGSL